MLNGKNILIQDERMTHFWRTYEALIKKITLTQNEVI